MLMLSVKQRTVGPCKKESFLFLFFNETRVQENQHILKGFDLLLRRRLYFVLERLTLKICFLIHQYVSALEKSCALRD